MAKFLFVTDLDNTFVGDDKALLDLKDRLEQSRQEYGSKIVYATGRSPLLYQQIKDEKNLLEPDALILSVGTEIYLDGSDTPDSEWSEKLSSGWNRELLVSTTTGFPELVPQPDSEQRPFKVSFLLQEDVAQRVLPQLESELQKSGLDVKLIYSSGIDLDIVPSGSDKGQAVQFLRQKWKFVAEVTVVCGDSGNDIALFSVGSERGIIVGNARPELLQWYNQNPADYRYLATNFCAGGILEGLKHFGFLE
ncbi:MAG: sucrose-phosphate phosphatase [Brasilonema octagenarum HA4186-MV1]|uniref:sucrose-phosphate phosphatase n=2 Tax=Brasilonema TaxID=383614 RepID=A0A856MRU2_9CYAN|nr:sucrose-phosphate phosphatase [Brasilonema sennae]MBW4624159.1 sucrose-phosphate phosphatase [Brasilonema octagenarum HA4186-MV1]NMF62810.1 sucrose-phosphate phosphatase [Brasilonema octagenarum UFV-OR1]QDL12277.1 sucrose-phosphate phosphatase [Brasilonema sennae CENA114]QDL18655.1 sucrose-phosphate phosphatase [Brasilonema octagenarum UFV-E1]